MNRRLRQHVRLIAAMLTVLLVLSAGAVVWVERTLSETMRAIQAEQTTLDLTLLAHAVEENLVKGNYAAAISFLRDTAQRWESMARLRAVARNGLVLLDHQNPNALPGSENHVHSSRIRFGAGNHVDLTVEMDGMHVDEATAAMRTALIVAFTAFIAVAMGGLWLVVKKLAIDPLRAAAERRRADAMEAAAAKLAAANDDLKAEILQRRAAEAELRLAASVYHNTIEGIVVTDLDGTILSVNPAFTEITGYRPEEVLGRNPRILKSDHHDEAFYQELWRSLLDTGSWEGEIWNRRKNGEIFLEWQTINAINGPDGQPHRYVAVFNDITEVRRKDERIRHLAFHDALTDLPNRQLLLDRLEHSLAVNRRDNARLAVMFLDLDRFKTINDTLGHDAGDDLLCEVARRLSSIVRKSDTVARLGGDEFVVLLERPRTDDSVARVAGEIHERLREPILVGGQTVHVTPSIGVSLFPRDGDDVATLMKNADTAMYAAKDAGRGITYFFDSSMNVATQKRLAIENDLRIALLRGDFELHYQPRLSIETGCIAGAEALLRWRRGDGGLVYPHNFIPVAEETGLIGRIGDWAIDRACAQAHDWLGQGLDAFPVSVNVSARQFASDLFVDHLLKTLDMHDVPAGCLELEMTESVLLQDSERSLNLIGRLHGVGLRIAIDDFGTGYSSFDYLRRLPFDTLKIDRTFIRDVETRERDAVIVRAVSSLARALKLDLVAEGVETDGQLQFLRSCRCGLAQGYLFAHPLPTAEFEVWVRAQGRLLASDAVND